MITITTNALPTPIARESRSSYGILWFATKEDADVYGAHIRARGDRFNGGFYDGLPCGRDVSQDRKDKDGTTIGFAVTTA